MDYRQLMAKANSNAATSSARVKEAMAEIDAQKRQRAAQILRQQREERAAAEQRGKKLAEERARSYRIGKVGLVGGGLASGGVYLKF